MEESQVTLEQRFPFLKACQKQFNMRAQLMAFFDSLQDLYVLLKAEDHPLVIFDALLKTYADHADHLHDDLLATDESINDPANSDDEDFIEEDSMEE